MRNHRSISQYLGVWPAPALLLLFQLSSAVGQLVPEVAKFGYADTIFVNGKIVSMDDRSSSANVANIYQAVAIKGDKIVKLGTSSEVRALARPDTKILTFKILTFSRSVP